MFGLKVPDALKYQRPHETNKASDVPQDITAHFHVANDVKVSFSKHIQVLTL